MNKDYSNKVNWAIPKTNASSSTTKNTPKEVSKNICMLHNLSYNELNEMIRESSSK